MKFNEFRLTECYLSNMNYFYEIFFSSKDIFNRNIQDFFDFKNTIPETRLKVEEIRIKGIKDIKLLEKETFQLTGNFLFKENIKNCMNIGDLSIDKI